MGCIYLILALISPRVLLVALWLLTDYVGRAFDFWVWPLLGLIFFPITTLALVWGFNTHFGVFQIAAVMIAVFMDLGANSGAEHQRRKRSRE